MPHDIHLKVKKEKLGAHLGKKALNKGLFEQKRDID